MAKLIEAVYSLEGTLLEVCSCNVLCPCWIGEDPDGGECWSIVAYHVDSGQITGIDVSARSAVTVNHIPGNMGSSAASSAVPWPTSPSSSGR
jgi:hypothetical protein